MGTDETANLTALSRPYLRDNERALLEKAIRDAGPIYGSEGIYEVVELLIDLRRHDQVNLVRARDGEGRPVEWQTLNPDDLWWSP